MQISDHQQRQQALDITQSFIVQAPAGSGKTELLTQRYLALLGQACQHPEEILAITFTRKAAAEMRQRIVLALQCAQQAKPEEAHAQRTWQLAKQVLARNEDAGWQLLENPNRLRVQTIDSLCASLSRQLPILSQFGSQPAIADNAQILYEQAINRLFKQLDDDTPWNHALQTLLLHLDNRVDRVGKLLIQMLAKRDQWMPILQRTKAHADRKLMIEQSLAMISVENINQLLKHFSVMQREELHRLIRFAAANLMAGEVESPICLGWQADLPNPFLIAESSNRNTLQQLQDFWQAVCELLLTQKNIFRKSPNKNQGFLAHSSTKDKTTKAHLKEMKTQVVSFIDHCREKIGLLEALSWFRSSPPLNYPEKDWALVEALLELLPIAAAQLTLIFRETSQVDFTEISQAALLALGDEDAPTDLALSLDYRIQHILLDEFQDTSITQAHLLEKLTNGWEKNGDKTLFIVGDPMQSIYRFRHAEVGLFLRAQQQGIGQLVLTSIQLSQNFRSTANVVNWVNQQFSQLFPEKNNIALGAIHYAKSKAAHSITPDSTIACHLAADEVHEANIVVNLLAQCKGNTAILVRARSHLYEIIKTLKSHHINYQAIDIDRLADKPIIQDLLALTKALLHPADSIAWLSILRAPWCGLSLSDLHHIANGRGNHTIWQQLQSHEVIGSLSANGKTRALFFIDVIKTTMLNYQRQPLADWIHDTWKHLNGEKCLEKQTDHDNALAYFEFLDQYNENDLSNIDAFEKQLFNLFSPPSVESSELQLLTIHKSKGLEFDNIILPGLGRSSAATAQELLSWLERPRETSGEDLLIAPINTVQSSDDKIYQYIREQEKLRERYETIRLFYVAATRAKENLHLVGHAEFDAENETWKPKPSTLLKLIWPVMEQEFKYEPPQETFDREIVALTHVNTKRLALNQLETPPFALENHQAHHSPHDFLWRENTAINLGIVTHKILQIISESDLDDWNEEKISHSLPRWRQLLLNMKIKPSELDHTLALIHQAVSNILNDKTGRWILSQHGNAHAELALSQTQPDKIIHAVIDRCFVDEKQEHWVIDYKVIEHFNPNNNNEIEALTQEYLPQLQHYAELLSNSSELPIKIALYLPLQSHLLELTQAIPG